ncbi:hypothetical protein SKAU_G00103430 [Synaphobranchus kaupii]|uniref:Uncharacterized protein n=1 Tax=Synaphobranchus kaupii TaxID=118154 RepID=A0A9Q1FZW6_SYNKA|nr:hypothetical protein SKAU_G00103430 [Synaphobranchus kaupii]
MFDGLRRGPAGAQSACGSIGPMGRRAQVRIRELSRAVQRPLYFQNKQGLSEPGVISPRSGAKKGKRNGQ